MKNWIDAWLIYDLGGWHEYRRWYRRDSLVVRPIPWVSHVIKCIGNDFLDNEVNFRKTDCPCT